jgi:hypothetical protein
MSKAKVQMESQIPSTHIQINSNIQYPKLLVIGIWWLDIIWDLEFEI